MSNRARRFFLIVFGPPAPRWLSLGLFALGLLASGCAPETDLTNVSLSGGDSPPSLGPGGAVLVEPPPGSTGVPLNLEAVVLRLPSAVAWGANGVRICDGAAAAVPAAAPAEEACSGGVCYRVALAGTLPPGAACSIALGSGNAEAGGQALASGIVGTFDTATAADTSPPVLSQVTVAAAGPCLSVSFSTDEPAAGTVVVTAGGVETDSPGGVGQTTFDVAVPLGGLPAMASASVVVSVADRAGNVAASSPLVFETPPALPPIVVTEVLANAAGPEPAQEYVELRNLGTEPVPLAGLRIEDSKGGDDLPGETLAAGGYALVVTSGYDPAQGQDPAPRAGTLLLRVDSRIGADGLSNGGEAVKLVQGDAVVSSYGGWVDVSSSAWAGRAVHRLIQSACDRKDAWNAAPLPPTPGGGPP
jgi:hypothetical protein